MSTGASTHRVYLDPSWKCTVYFKHSAKSRPACHESSLALPPDLAAHGQCHAGRLQARQVPLQLASGSDEAPDSVNSPLVSKTFNRAKGVLDALQLKNMMGRLCHNGDGVVRCIHDENADTHLYVCAQ
jgi:hypothetical protein